MIRTHRDAEDTTNNLNNFPLEMKQEFWHLCQKVVADCRIPSILCHHFGEWRSAGHFHVHIVTKKTDFAKYTASKVSDAGYDAILAKLESKEKFLIKRHLNEFKAPEVADLKKNPPERDERNFCSGEWKDFRVELDPVYPWVKFIPKEAQVFSSDQREIQKQLETYREQAFSQMCEFAEHHKLKGYRIWLKLAGDAFNWNAHRDAANRVYGVISVHTPEYYAMNPNAEEWLSRYEKAEYDVLATV